MPSSSTSSPRRCLVSHIAYVGYNELGPLSMMRMREARWDSLTILWLGIFDLIREAINFEIKDANICRG